MKIRLDGKQYECMPGDTVLTVAKRHHIDIPSLCSDNINDGHGFCRICVVRLESGKIVPACEMAVSEGLSIGTIDPELRQIRQTVLSLLAAGIDRHLSPERQKLPFFKLKKQLQGKRRAFKLEKRWANPQSDRNKRIERNLEYCILCRRCIAACPQHILAVGFKGYQSALIAGTNDPFKKAGCDFCGQCVLNCPTGALRLNLNRSQP